MDGMADSKSCESDSKGYYPIGKEFLGRDPYYGFGNETAVLTLPAVPEGSLVTVDFELFIILTWDGNNSGGVSRARFLEAFHRRWPGAA